MNTIDITSPKVQTTALHRAHIRLLLSRLDQKTFSTTAYDTAWVARVRDAIDGKSPGPGSYREGNAAGEGMPSYPQAMVLLRHSQHPDGSWGSDIEYYHDRILSTLSAILALAENGNYNGDRAAIHRGEQYIQRNFDQLSCEPHDTVGFELLLPVLFDQAIQLGLDLPYAKCEPYRRIRAEKLGMIPPDLLYSRQVSSTHSLEFLGNSLAAIKLSGLQEPNGSYGNSPSATAYALRHCPVNDLARTYLAEVLARGSGAANPAHPVDVFNKAWVLYNIELTGILSDFSDLARPHLDDLWQSWNPSLGIGFARQYPVPDLDDTAVVFKLLHRAGYPVDPNVFLGYEKESYFTCYSFERTPSIGANVHLLDALGACLGYEHRPRMVKKILRFLRTTRLDNAYWLDKWHISPYYITTHAIIALIGLDNHMARDAVLWILSTQQEDGSWGWYRPSCEETAYCLQALITYNNLVEGVDSRVISRAEEYLNQQYGIWKMPSMWVEKCLYTPAHIVETAILSALMMSGNL